MRAQRALTACAVAAMSAAAAVGVAGCGGGSGSDDSATIAPGGAPTTTSASVSPTASSAAKAGAPLTIDPAVALPADVKVVFDWTMPADTAQHAALTAAANYLQSVDHAVVKQNLQDPPMYAHAANTALAHGKEYVQANVSAKLTLSGTDRFYLPAFTQGSGGAKATSVGITLCEDQSKLYSKEIATGKVRVTGDDPRNYLGYSLVVVKVATAHPFWQVQGLAVTEGAKQCMQ
ncbi:hypothetical protein [Streptomyces sp. NPDC021020]|uniref:hypothetical protein n=1 Tax=Streptomyces sp. NPDC021020 TaxID=3365109 RepID=UPI0037ABFA87